MRIHLAALAFTAAATSAVAQPLTPSPRAQQAMDNLSICGSVTQNRQIVEPVLVKCLQAVKDETSALARAHLEIFRINGPAYAQDAVVSAIAHGQITRQCSASFKRYNADNDKTYRDTILGVTDITANCLDTLEQSGRLKTIRIEFDQLRYAAVAQASNCLRGMVDPDAAAACRAAVARPIAP